MDWGIFWNAWMALATTGLVGVTIVLVCVGYKATQWAQLTFGQAEETEAKKREPLVALVLWQPESPDKYLPYAREDQLQTHLKWFNSISKSEFKEFARRYRLFFTCFAYNVGDGPALRVKVPYRMEVSDFTTDGTESKTDSVEGEFQILRVPPGGLGTATTYLNVVYYPKYRIELLLDKVTVSGIDAAVSGALTEGSEPIREGNNRAIWDVMRNMPPPPPPPPDTAPPPPWMSGSEEPDEDEEA